MTINLRKITQGERGTLTFTWEFPENITSPASISGAAITATMTDEDGVTTAVSGTLTGTAATTCTWALSAGDSGTAGTFTVLFKAVAGGVTTYTLQATLEVITNPAVTGAQNDPLVSISVADAAWLTAASARLADGDDVATRDNDGTAGNLTVLDASGNAVDAGYGSSAFDAAGAAAAAQAASQKLISFDIRNYGAAVDGVTDDTAAVLAAITAAEAVGGEVVFPSGTILMSNSITLPATHGIMASEAKIQGSMRWRGMGAFSSGQQGNPLFGTIILCTYVGSDYEDAKIKTYGMGNLDIQGITFKDTTLNATTPFLKTTNTTLKINRCAFVGATGGTSCQQDAIVLGGTEKPAGTGFGSVNGPFQGYGTVISECYFNRVRRAIYGRSYCNQTQIYSNMMDKGCGTNNAAIGCVEYDGSLTGAGADPDYCTNNTVYGNYMHWVGGYTYLVVIRKGANNFVGFNGFVDPGVNQTAAVRLESDGVYFSSLNMVFANYCHIQTHMSEDALSTDKNLMIAGNTSGYANIFGSIKTFKNFIVPTIAAIQDWSINDGVDNLLRWQGGAKSAQLIGALNLVGNSRNGTALNTTQLNIGNNSTDDNAIVNFNPPTGRGSQIQFKRAGTNSWLFYDANSAFFFFRDSVNSKMHMTFQPGAGTGGLTEINSALTVTGVPKLSTVKSGATQAAAGAAVNEIWKTSGHATLPDNVLMIGI